MKDALNNSLDDYDFKSAFVYFVKDYSIKSAFEDLVKDAVDDELQSRGMYIGFDLSSTIESAVESATNSKFYEIESKIDELTT